ncbi:hypothetical protein REPUB_Repub13aG0039300 [Reevesia pubescens]
MVKDLEIMLDVNHEKEIISICGLRSNLYGISFVDSKCMEEVLDDGHWSVIRCALNFQKWKVDRAVNEIDFLKINYWVQICNLPLEIKTFQNAIKIGRVSEEVIKVEDLSWRDGRGICFLRIRVTVKVDKPLLAGFWVPRLGKDELGDMRKYGMWMRAALVRDIWGGNVFSNMGKEKEFDENGSASEGIEGVDIDAGESSTTKNRLDKGDLVGRAEVGEMSRSTHGKSLRFCTGDNFDMDKRCRIVENVGVGNMELLNNKDGKSVGKGVQAVRVEHCSVDACNLHEESSSNLIQEKAEGYDLACVELRNSLENNERNEVGRRMGEKCGFISSNISYIVEMPQNEGTQTKVTESKEEIEDKKEIEGKEKIVDEQNLVVVFRGLDLKRGSAKGIEVIDWRKGKKQRTKNGYCGELIDMDYTEKGGSLDVIEGCLYDQRECPMKYISKEIGSRIMVRKRKGVGEKEQEVG